MDVKFGVVESIDDPLEAGRVQVRVYSVHTVNKTILPTSDLPWAGCMQDSYDGTIGGIGKSPTGIQVGTQVVVIFLDRLMQVPFVLGTVPGINSEVLMKLNDSNISRGNSTYGFQQEVDDTYIGEPDTNFQARTDKVNPKHTSRESGKESGIPTATGGSWDEPSSTMSDSQYPHSKVRETTSGHLEEWDDTPGNERILKMHSNGSYEELSNDGKSTKIIGDTYSITTGDGHVKVAGDIKVLIGGDAEVYVEGETYLKSDGKTTVECPEIELGIDASEPMVMGDKLADWIANELKTQYDSHYHIGNLGLPTSPPVVPLIEGTAAKGGLVYSTRNKTQK